MIATTPRHLLGLEGLAASDLGVLLDLAALMRRHPSAWRDALEGRAVACLFEQRSTRSRVSLEVAIGRLGAHAVMLHTAELELGNGDSLAETARLFSCYCDAIALRTPRHRDLLELAEHAGVPVLNALTDREYPCRALADCLTLRDRFGDLHGLPVAFVGDDDAVSRSLIEAAALAGFELRVAAPVARRPDPAVLARAGQAVRVYDDPREAAKDALAIYATGTPDDDYGALLALAAPRAVYMHTRPWAAGDAPASVTAEQAGNLLAVEQAVLRAYVGGEWEA
jgi:ornithine carbamoyltransferase